MTTLETIVDDIRHGTYGEYFVVFRDIAEPFVMLEHMRSGETCTARLPSAVLDALDSVHTVSAMSKARGPVTELRFA